MADDQTFLQLLESLVDEPLTVDDMDALAERLTAAGIDIGGLPAADLEVLQALIDQALIDQGLVDQAHQRTGKGADAGSGRSK